MNKNGGKKLLAMIMALAMVFVAGVIVVGNTSDLDAATTPDIPTSEVPSTGIADAGSYVVKNDNTVLNIAGASGTATLVVLDGLTVTINGKTDTSIVITVYTAAKDATTYSDADSNVVISNLVKGSITIGAKYVASDKSVLTLSGDCTAGVSITGNHAIGSDGLKIVGSDPTTITSYGIKEIPFGSPNVYRFYPDGYNTTVELSYTTGGDSVVVKNGTALISQGENSVKLTKIESTNGITVTATTGGIPTIGGTATGGDSISIVKGVMKDSTLDAAKTNMVKVTADGGSYYIKQVSAPSVLSNITAYAIQGTVVQTENITTTSAITLSVDSNYVISEGVEVSSSAGMVVTAAGQLRVFGSITVDSTTLVNNGAKVYVGPQGKISGFEEIEQNKILNTNVTSGADSLVSGNLTSVMEDAILGDAAVIPEGKTVTVTGNLGLNGKVLTVNGTLIIAEGASVFTTSNGNTIVLGTAGSIINNGSLGAVLGVTVQKDGSQKAVLEGVSGVGFFYNKSGEFCIGGEIQKVSSASAGKVTVTGVVVGSDLTIASNVELVLGGNIAAADKVDVIIDGSITGAFTFTMGKVSEIQVNGKLGVGTVISVPTGTYNTDGSVTPGTSVTIKTETDVVSGFVIETKKVAVVSGSNVTYKLMAYISGELKDVTDSLTPSVTVTGSYVVSDSFTVRKGVTAADLASVEVLGSIVKEHGATITAITYIGAKYEVLNAGKVDEYTTYYTKLADAMGVIDTTKDKTVTANVASVDIDIIIGANQILNITVNDIAQNSTVTVQKNGKLTGSIVKVKGALVVESGAQSITNFEYASKKVDTEGNTVYAGFAVALDNSKAGDVLTVDSDDYTGTLEVKEGVEIIITGSLKVTGGIIIPEGAKITAASLIVNGPNATTADIAVAGTLDLSEGSITGNYKITSTGSVILSVPSTNINGAYYTDSNGNTVVTSVSNAIVYATEKGLSEITITGKIVESSDIVLDGVDLKISLNSVVTLGNISLKSSKVISAGDLTATITALNGVGDAAVDSVVSVKGSTVTFEAKETTDVAGITTYAFTIDKIEGEIEVQKGTLTISNDNTAMANSKLIIDDAAELIISAGITSIDADDVSVTVDGKLTVKGAVVITGTSGAPVVNGTLYVAKNGSVDATSMKVLGLIEVADGAIFTVSGENVIVGDAPTFTAGTGSISGTVVISGANYLKVYAGSDVSEMKIEGKKSTEYYVNGQIYATVYATGSVNIIDAVGTTGPIDVTELNKLPNVASISTLVGYMKDKNGNQIEAENQKVGLDAVYVTMSAADVRIDVSIDQGTKLKVGPYFYTQTGSFTLKAGTYPVAASALPGYTGTAIVEFWINGVQQTVENNEIKLTADMNGSKIVIVSTFGSAPGPTPAPVDPSKDFIVSTSVVNDKKVIVSVISLDGGYLVAGTEVEVTFTTLVETVAFGQTVYKPTPVVDTITIGDDKPTLENSTYELADILGDKYAVINVISKIGTAGFGNTSLNYKG